MAKVFTSKEFIKKLKWLVNDVPNVYHSGKGWSTLNSAGKWQFDCVLSVKCLLWKFRADKNAFRGGTVYLSNGVADFSCNGALTYCNDVSTDFSKTTRGEYVCMKGTSYNHTGVILKEATATELGDMFECTSCSAWGVKKCVISQFDTKGNRYYKGKRCLKWTYHGKLKWIDYSDEPVPMNQTAILQECMNKQWSCGLEVDGHFGPLTREQCRKHQLTFNCKAPIMVKWLQTRLKELGYSLAVDGSFGYDTKKKVIDFQKKKHLNPDAIVGENTYKALTE